MTDADILAAALAEETIIRRRLQHENEELKRMLNIKPPEEQPVTILERVDDSNSNHT